MNSLPTSFSESMRYENYDLTPDSLVIDCGFYKGEFTLEIARRYDCRILAYEPIREFYEVGVELVKPFPKICLRNLGVGKNNEMNSFHVKGGLTGGFNFDGPIQGVEIKSIFTIMPHGGCDLLKLNVEGAEFEVLECMFIHDCCCDIPLTARCKNIQVQFHQVVPDFQARYEAIRAKLLKTHHLTYDFPWCWQNFRRNDAH